MRVRRNGYARNISESEIGLYALAVPIIDDAGQALCSLTISGPEVRIEPQRDETLSPENKNYWKHSEPGQKN